MKACNDAIIVASLGLMKSTGVTYAHEMKVTETEHDKMKKEYSEQEKTRLIGTKCAVMLFSHHDN